jgi:hypothetical protein
MCTAPPVHVVPIEETADARPETPAGRGSAVARLVAMF